MRDSELTSIVRDIRAGWLPARIYSDAQLYEEEQTRLFARTWHFVGHESEIPLSGDYVVRLVLDDSFIVIRGEDQSVRAHLNMCRHRGMQLVRAEKGNARRLSCPYHMWSYNTAGKLTGVPYHDEAYGGEAALCRADTSLIAAPRLEAFGGLLFVNLDADAAPLIDYLGDFANYLPFYTSPSAEGLEFRGPQRWRAKANWKLGSENFSGDAYHTPHTHASMAEIGVTAAASGGYRKGGALYHAGRGSGATFKMEEGSFEDRLASIGYTPDMIRSRKEHWPDAVKDLIGVAGFIPSAATIFPNLSMLHLWVRVGESEQVVPFTTFRLWKPTGVNESETMSWFAVDKSASAEFKELSYKAYLSCFGSSGMFEQDDMEIWSLVTRMSQGQMGREMMLHSRMGLQKDGAEMAEALAEFPGGGVARVGFSEQNQRRWFEHWCSYMDQPPQQIRTGAIGEGGGK